MEEENEREKKKVGKTWSTETRSWKRRTMTITGLARTIRKRNPILEGCTIILAKSAFQS